jgi:hypothetical protein
MPGFGGCVGVEEGDHESLILLLKRQRNFDLQFKKVENIPNN